MAVLYGYFDESGKSHEHDIVVFSGFVTSWEWWEDLADEWRRLLRECNLPALHFAQERRRTSLLKRFLGLIKTHVEYGISAAVKVEAFAALSETNKKGLGGDAHYLAFKCVAYAIVKRMLKEPGSIINFTCDEDEQTTLDCYRWYKKIKRQDAVMRQQWVSFAVADDLHFPQLQAADLMAGVCRIEAENRLLGTQQDSELFEYLKHRRDGRLSFSTAHFGMKELPKLAIDFDAVVGGIAHPAR